MIYLKIKTPSVKINVLTFIFSLLLLAFVPTAYSQNCLVPDSSSHPHFPQGDPNLYYSGVVHYFFDNIPNGPQRTQIETAITNWNNALASGCSRVSFAPGPTGELGNSILTFKNGYVPNQGAARYEDVSYGGLVGDGTVIFNPELTINGRLFYDPNVGGYDSVFTKQAMHEIGHLLGLSHYTTGHPNACIQQSRNSSIMNDACGYNDNGSYFGTTFYPNNQTTNVTSCDFPSVNSGDIIG